MPMKQRRPVQYPAMHGSGGYIPTAPVGYMQMGQQMGQQMNMQSMQNSAAGAAFMNQMHANQMHMAALHNMHHTGRPTLSTEPYQASSARGQQHENQRLQQRRPIPNQMSQNHKAMGDNFKPRSPTSTNR